MGGNQGAIFQQGEPLTNYDVVQKVPEHNISYLKHKISSKEYMIREFAINDKTEYTQTCQKIKNRKKLESQNLTKLERYSEQMQDNLCSSFYKIFAMWEYPSHTLADEINERALQKRRFQQNELFSIIASIIQGMSCLQAGGVKHQCLTTSSILFDQSGTLKVADPLTSMFTSNFDRINTNRKLKNIYIAPQQCESLKNQRPIPNRNPYKSDVFVSGLIVLECGLLEKMDSVFVQEFEEVDSQELVRKLTEFGNIYSKDLKLTVETMLTRDPKQRMDWIGLKQYVPQKGQTESNKFSNVNLPPFQSQYKAPLNPQMNKVTLGGNKQFVLNTNSQATYLPPFSHTRYGAPVQSHISPYQASSSGLYTVPQSNFNQTFGQPVQSISYVPQNVYGSSTIQSSNVSYSPFMYGNQKVSSYINEKPSIFERPTEEFFINPLSKITPEISTGLTGRQSSSFPLNSQFQFKKDFSSVNTQNIQSYVPPSYAPSYEPVKVEPYQLFSTSDYNKAKAPQSISKSIHNQDKTQTNSQNQGSPFLPNYVKDAKSITYDKGLQSSHFSEQKSVLISNQFQTYGAQQSGINKPRQSYNQQSLKGNNEFEQSPNYQSISKNTSNNNFNENKNTFVVSSNPILYQPLGSNPSTANKPVTYQQQSQRSPFDQNKPQEKSPSQPSPYEYKQINQMQSPQPHELQYVIEHFKQGSRYEGTKFQDMRHGQGKFFYQDGGMYEGNWKLNKMDGFGKLYYQSGKIAYEGNWTDDQFQGFGKLYNQQPDQLQDMFEYDNFDAIEQYWVYYEGNFMSDQKDGEGKMVFSNGEVFIGNFSKDMVDGPGQFHRSNGEVVRGVWSQNQLVQVEQ